MVLKANMANNRSIGHTGQFSLSGTVQPMVYNLFTVSMNDELMTLTLNFYLVPFSGFFGHIKPWPNSSDYATMVMMTHLIIRFAG